MRTYSVYHLLEDDTLLAHTADTYATDEMPLVWRGDSWSATRALSEAREALRVHAGIRVF